MIFWNIAANLIDKVTSFFYLCANIPDMKNFLYSNGYASAFDPLDSVSGRGLVPLGVR
jgi:hypothetical protein